MDEKKIAFIICMNDDKYVKECIYYIQSLLIPEGYEIDILTISDAESMCAAYNAAMNNTNAKYKIYLHQDVFLLNQNILYEILEIFQDPKVGIIGVVGADKLPSHAKAIEAWNYGNVLLCHGNHLQQVKSFGTDDDPVITVDAIDGMLMITQYDLYWDDNTFNGFDFYDISQCMEFRKHGWKIVLPKSENVWVLHDYGISSEISYNKYRKKFCEKYESYGFHYDEADEDICARKISHFETAKQNVLKALNENNTADVKKALQIFEANGYMDTEVFYIKNYTDIIEKNKNLKIKWPEFQEYFDHIKFNLWKLQFRNETEEDFLTEIRTGKLPLEVLQEIMQHCIIDQNIMWKKLLENMQRFRF